MMEGRNVMSCGEEHPSPTATAIQQIVDVFEGGYRAAAQLRRDAEALSPRQLQSELAAIEQSMLRQITSICEDYKLGSPALPPS